MTTDQIILFSLLGFVFLFLIWGRWRYDLVATTALMIGLLTGIVPVDKAFSGFGHPATVIIALVLILSRALSNSGAVELIARQVMDKARGLEVHIALMSGIGAASSALINNVAALALLMPVDIQAANREGRSPALTLMPLSFATILGGMITLIGTPPNIVIAEFRREALGESFKMFDFAPVGLACAAVGVAFIAIFGWRLIPQASAGKDATQALLDLDGYIAEVAVPEGTPAIGRRVRDLDPEADESEVAVVGLVRRGERMPGMARRVEIQVGDILVVEAGAEAIDKFLGLLKLEYARRDRDKGFLTDGDLSLMEVAVPQGARIEGRSAFSLHLLYRHGMTLLGVSRQGKRFTDRVRRLEIMAGDVLLLLGPGERLVEMANWLGCLPLAERGLQVLQRGKASLAIGIFAIAVLLASTGVLYLPIALGCAAVLMVALNIVPIRQVYESVEWSVIVLLGCM
ncbi:MAG: SLC13 family permease, partial [Rhodospirillales bacterium]|nr:SLC13 family permease [Rhodospirillales bacterium]